MNKMTICFLILASTIQCGFAFGNNINKDLSELKPKYQSADIKFILPVNVATSNMNLSIRIPSHFTLVNDKRLTFMNLDKNQSNRTEVIIVNPLIGTKHSAKKYLEEVAKRRKDNFKVLKNYETNYKMYTSNKYEEAFSTFSYERDNDKYIGTMFIACGPIDCAYVEYLIDLKDEKQDIQKLKEFFNTNIKVLYLKEKWPSINADGHPQESLKLV